MRTRVSQLAIVCSQSPGPSAPMTSASRSSRTPLAAARSTGIDVAPGVSATVLQPSDRSSARLSGRLCTRVWGTRSAQPSETRMLRR